MEFNSGNDQLDNDGLTLNNAAFSTAVPSRHSRRHPGNMFHLQLKILSSSSTGKWRQPPGHAHEGYYTSSPSPTKFMSDDVSGIPMLTAFCTLDVERGVV
ncbi:hypothetical protein AX14_001899 [Amanita brunnescens Koide BX004]|nr:hypothetical protein AX14_001899 [Amanita brunnescens Koide BX004]